MELYLLVMDILLFVCKHVIIGINSLGLLYTFYLFTIK